MPLIARPASDRRLPSDVPLRSRPVPPRPSRRAASSTARDRAAGYSMRAMTSAARASSVPGLRSESRADAARRRNPLTHRSRRPCAHSRSSCARRQRVEAARRRVRRPAIRAPDSCWSRRRSAARLHVPTRVPTANPRSRHSAADRAKARSSAAAARTPAGTAPAKACSAACRLRRR